MTPIPPDAPAFRLFGTAHLVVIALTLGLPALLWLTMRGPAWVRHRRAIRWSLVVLLVVNWIAYDAFQFAGGRPLSQGLPMQLCDWATVTIVVALLTDRQAWYELSYFWGLAGTFQAILTPNLQVSFPDLRFVSFFVAHCGIVVGVLFLTFVERLRPRPGSILRTMAWSEMYLAAALAVNDLTGENYGFLTHRPEGASLLDYFSDHHTLYLLEMNLLALVFFLILYAPFWAYDLSRGRKAA